MHGLVLETLNVSFPLCIIETYYDLKYHLGMNRSLCRKASVLRQRKLFSVIGVFSCGDDNEPISQILLFKVENVSLSFP